MQDAQLHAVLETSLVVSPHGDVKGGRKGVDQANTGPENSNVAQAVPFRLFPRGCFMCLGRHSGLGSKAVTQANKCPHFLHWLSVLVYQR